MKFAVLDDYVLSFISGLTLYGIVKREFKELCDSDKSRLKMEYKEYKKRSNPLLIIVNQLISNPRFLHLNLAYFCINGLLNF
ncbi:MAG: hypothetical protein ACLRHW_19490 [Coprobacillus cateniformis]